MLANLVEKYRRRGLAVVAPTLPLRLRREWPRSTASAQAIYGRPHSSLGYLTPAAFKAKHLATLREGAHRRCRLAPIGRPKKRLTDPLGVILQ
jgi:hypothetical protein